jgi:hypothetical protein
LNPLLTIVIDVIAPLVRVQVAEAPYPASPAAEVIVIVGAEEYPAPPLVIAIVIDEDFTQLKLLFKYKVWFD